MAFRPANPTNAGRRRNTIPSYEPDIVHDAPLPIPIRCAIVFPFVPVRWLECPPTRRIALQTANCWPAARPIPAPVIKRPIRLERMCPAKQLSTVRCVKAGPAWGKDKGVRCCATLLGRRFGRAADGRDRAPSRPRGGARQGSRQRYPEQASARVPYLGGGLCLAAGHCPA